MEIIRTTIENKRELYRVLHGNSEKPSNHVGEVLTVKDWALVNAAGQDGVEHEILMFTADNAVFGTISRTFIDAFIDIAEMFGDGNIGDIEIAGGKSKAGREFVTCNVV